MKLHFDIIATGPSIIFLATEGRYLPRAIASTEDADDSMIFVTVLSAEMDMYLDLPNTSLS